MLAILFASAAHAQTAAPDAGGLASFIPIILIFAVFYFLLIRPQSVRLKKHDEMVKALKRNDRVVTGGGILGKVTKVNDQENTLEVEIAKDVVVQVNRASVSEVLGTSSQANNDDKTKKPKAKKAKAKAKAPAKAKSK